MKKSTMKSLVAYLNGETITNLPEIKAELEAELAKDADAKAAKVAEYDEIREAVFSVLSDAPMTVTEIFNACGDKLPEGCSKNKVQYGILNYWANEIVKIEGKPNQYRRK